MALKKQALMVITHFRLPPSVLSVRLLDHEDVGRTSARS
jgi:hypothetical protein